MAVLDMAIYAFSPAQFQTAERACAVKPAHDGFYDVLIFDNLFRVRL